MSWRHVRGVLLVVLGLSCLGAGCSKLLSPQSVGVSVLERLPNVTAPTSSTTVVGWSVRGEGIERANVRFSTSTGSDVILYRFDRQKYTFAFEYSTSARSVAEWLAQAPEAVLALNGVYFQESYLPSGWLKTRGRIVGKRSYDFDKSGLLVLKPSFDLVTEPSRMEREQARSSEAGQSFPLLIAEGKSQVKEDSGKVARRTFVGLDKAGRYAYFGVVPYTTISLYELSVFLEKLPIAWQTVLNLDGGPSSGLVFRDTELSERIDSYLTVPNVILVKPKAVSLP
ncbi:phosphodiester glycosidase family protein [Patescibacteria group bacterium]|nr:phosphodiester glycosidase family protein [Patescibacteria group bacterium]